MNGRVANLDNLLGELELFYGYRIFVEEPPKQRACGITITDC